MFRYKPSIPVPYERQGYIYFRSLTYPNMTDREKQRIQGLCVVSAGPYENALLDHVTKGESVKYVCQKHYISSTTILYRAIRRYYELFPTDL